MTQSLVERLLEEAAFHKECSENGTRPYPIPALLTEAAAVLSTSDGEVERVTAWLYKREGGVGFECLAAEHQEHWRNQARDCLRTIRNSQSTSDGVQPLRNSEAVEGIILDFKACGCASCLEKAEAITALTSPAVVEGQQDKPVTMIEND